MFPVLEEIICNSNLKGSTYVEPFAGGAGAALALLIHGVVDQIWINDFDRAIYSFWRSIVYETNRFLDRLMETEVSISERNRQKAIYLDRKSKRFDLGFAAFYLNRTSVSGVLTAGPIGGANQDGKWKVSARFNKKTLSDRIERIAAFKGSIKITQLDGISLVKSHAREANHFFYLDPPYVLKGASLYLNHYSLQHHEALSRQLHAVRGANWILTYDKHPDVKRLYKDLRFADFSLNYNTFQSKIGNEFFILSDGLTL